MLFHELAFWIFLPVVLLLFYCSPFRLGKLVLLISSYVFYMWWDPRFILLILISTAIDYFAGRRLESSTGWRKRALLITSLVANLGFLGFFKYYNFFASSIAEVMGIAPNSLALTIILPVGISFYTFQSMSYTIDVYLGKLKPVRSFVDFALFVSFFPQLVAGPIVRACDFFPQLDHWRRPSEIDIQRGIVLILVGLMKKMIFADHFATISDAYYADVAANPGAITAWTATVAFGMQIFFDFSGYTDIARGCGKLLGFHFPINFRRPYLSTSITDFWRRWHISLSTWLRDYLYIPLGGNRHGRWMTYRNLMVTMVLGGLWHGASWNFVLWGTYHGVLLSLNRVFIALARATGTSVFFAQPILVPFKVAFTFALVTIGWVPFRASTLGETKMIINEMFRFGEGTSCLLAGDVRLIGMAMFFALLEERFQISSRIVTGPAAVRVAFYVCCFALLEWLAVTGEKIPFVYFQF